MKQINWSDHILNFLAVIIGVTLAFYVSDNSNRSKQDAELVKIVQSFIDELEDDREIYLEYQIPSNASQSKSIENALREISQKNTDSLARLIQEALSFNSYSPAGVTFNSIVASGKLDLLPDFKLRQDISNYYHLSAKEAEARGQFQIDFYKDQVMPWIINDTNIMNPNIDNLVEDVKLSNILILYKSLIDNKTSHYEYMAKESLSLENSLKELIGE